MSLEHDEYERKKEKKIEPSLENPESDTGEYRRVLEFANLKHRNSIERYDKIFCKSETSDVCNSVITFSGGASKTSQNHRTTYKTTARR